MLDLKWFVHNVSKRLIIMTGDKFKALCIVSEILKRSCVEFVLSDNDGSLAINLLKISTSLGLSGNSSSDSRIDIKDSECLNQSTEDLANTVSK